MECYLRAALTNNNREYDYNNYREFLILFRLIAMEDYVIATNDNAKKLRGKNRHVWLQSRSRSRQKS